ncbi:MAG: helix-turn-helix domain-containing protein [Chloroflexi bacterium]|nr:helix-turn-helix domain-containing protein [Chloroflexota bacterium]
MEQFSDIIREEDTSSLLTLEEVANMLEAHIDTIRVWADLNALPYLRMGPRGDLRFRMEDVIAFLLT